MTKESLSKQSLLAYLHDAGQKPKAGTPGATVCDISKSLICLMSDKELWFAEHAKSQKTGDLGEPSELHKGPSSSSSSGCCCMMVE